MHYQMQSEKTYEHSSWSIGRLIYEVIKDVDTLEKWLVQQKLLPITKICDENHEMRLYKTIKNSQFGLFRCRHKHKDMKERNVSQKRGTLFENSRIPMERTMMLCLLFANGYSVYKSIQEMNFFGITTSRETATQWFSYCREVISKWMLNHSNDNGKFGGPDTIVEVEETKFQLSKANEHDLQNSGEWLFGIVDPKTKRYCIEMYSQEDMRNHNALFLFIKKHILPQTVITSDSAVIRNVIEKSEIYFFKESDNKDSKSEPRTLLESIESWWLSYKRNYPSTSIHRTGERYMEYLFRRKMVYENTDCFEQMLELFRLNHPLENQTVMASPETDAVSKNLAV